MTHTLRTSGQAMQLLVVFVFLGCLGTAGFALADMPMSEMETHVAAAEEASSSDLMIAGSQCKQVPLLMVEGSNSCEIVSCGMGIKDTCKIECPKDKTPKCSCDCTRTMGPMCMEYKANCRCE